MKIERAVREKTYTLTSIAGPSGSGKTYSALLYARGLVGPEGKIGFIDTENRRSRFYADVAGGFDVIDLDPPFTPARYVEAIKAFERAGHAAIVVDSISHEWEGSGGVLEQAEAIEERTKRAGLHCWQKPKAGHKKLMNELLQTRAHLIFCCRVKEKVVQTKGKDGKTEIVNEGFVVVQEKSFIYEMTVSMMLEEGTHVPLLQKCPGDLLGAFPQGSRITASIGNAVREWSDKGEAIDEALENAKREGVLIANNGMSSLTEWWKGLSRDKQTKLSGLKDTLKSIAAAHDQMLADQMDAGAGDIAERISHARKQSQGDEGFNRDFVTRQIRDPIPDDFITESGSPPPEPDADEAPSPASSAGVTEPSPSSVTPTLADASTSQARTGDAEAEATDADTPEASVASNSEMSVLIRFAADLLPKAADTSVSAVALKAIEKRWGASEIADLSEDGKEIGRLICSAMRNIANGKVTLKDEAVELAGVLGCSPADIGG